MAKRKLRIPKAVLFVELYEDREVDAFLLLKKTLRMNKSKVIRQLIMDRAAAILIRN